MIIFGTRGVTTSPDKGVFYCPSCGPDSAYRQRRVRRFFTLYFIPLIPLDRLGEYIECDRCRHTYELGVLGYNPDKAAAEFEAGFHIAVRKMMVAMLLADGNIDDSEVSEVCRIYEDLTGKPMYPGDVQMEISDIQSSGQTIEALFQQIAPSLNEHGKEKVIESAWRIAAADGHIHADEQALMERIANVLQLTAGHRHGLFEMLKQHGKLPEPVAPPPLPGSRA